MTALIIIAIITAAVLFINLDGGVDFECEGTHHTTLFRVRIGFIGFDLPQGKKSEKDKRANERKKKEKHASKSEPEPQKESKDAMPGGIRAKAEFFSELYEKLQRDISKLLGYIIKRGIYVKKLDTALTIGTGDAAYTGMAYGAAAAFLYNMTALIHNNARLGSWSVDARPDFDKAVFYTKDRCIVRTRLAHIIVIGIMGLGIFLKYKRIHKKFSAR